MRLFDRMRGGRKARAAAEAEADLLYLQQWIAERRRAGGDAGARRLSDRLQIPVYDVQKVGYPQRMRNYDARRRILRERAIREELEG